MLGRRVRRIIRRLVSPTSHLFWAWFFLLLFSSCLDVIADVTCYITLHAIPLLAPIFFPFQFPLSPTLQAYRTAHQRRRRPSPPPRTLRNNGRSRWTGPSSEGRSVLVHLLLLVALMTGWLTGYFFVWALHIVNWLTRIGHFDRGRTGWRSLSKISIATTLASFLPIIPRPDPELYRRHPHQRLLSTPSLLPLHF